MPTYRLSYSFTDQIAGDENAIRKAVRDLSFSTAFSPLAHRTLVDEITESSARTALRRFLYAMDLPDDLTLANLHIERLDEPANVLPLLGGTHPGGEAA